MEKLFELLSDIYDFKSTQIRILKSLIRGEKSARELVNDTKIPVGSIYDLLDELVDLGFVCVKRSSNRIYYVEDFEGSLLEFADKDIDNRLKRREKLISNLRDNRQKVLSYDDYSRFKLGCLKYDAYPREILGVLNNYKFPFFFFGEDDYENYKRVVSKLQSRNFSKEDFLKNSVMKEKYKELGLRVDAKWLVSRLEFRRFLKLVERKDVLNRIRLFLRGNRNVKLRFYEGLRDNQFIVTHKSVQMQICDSPMFVGLIILDKNTCDIYRKNFECLWRDSKSFDELFH